MTRKKRYTKAKSEELYNKIKAFQKDGAETREIADILGVPMYTIYNILKKYETKRVRVPSFAAYKNEIDDVQRNIAKLFTKINRLVSYLNLK